MVDDDDAGAVVDANAMSCGYSTAAAHYTTCALFVDALGGENRKNP